MRRARTPHRWQWVAVAASVVAIVFGALWLADGGTDSGSPDSTAVLACAAESASGARTARLVDDGGDVLAKAVVVTATAVATSRRSCHLPPRVRPISCGEITRTGTISLGVLGREPKTVAFKAAAPTQSLAITTEVVRAVCR